MTLLRLLPSSLGTQSWMQLMEFVKATKLISIIRRKGKYLRSWPSCRTGVGEINSTKTKISHVVTQGKNLSCLLEAQELQMPWKTRWVPGRAVLIPGCLKNACQLWSWKRHTFRMDQANSFPQNWASSSFIA